MPSYDIPRNEFSVPELRWKGISASAWGRARERQQVGEGLELLAGHVAELLAVHRRHRFIERGDEGPARVGDGRHDHAPVATVAEAADEPPLFQSVQEAGHVGVALDHALRDVSTRRPIGAGTAQDPEHVELGERKIVRPEECRLGLQEGISRPQDAEEDLLLDVGERDTLPNFTLQGTGHG